MEGQEADDVIATLARQVEEAGEQTIVVTGDLDLLQLVDELTTVLTTRRGITDLGRYDAAAVRERFGLEPSQLPDYRGLKGDPSDNLPGIPGVGEKTATKLLQAAGSLDALVANPSVGRERRSCKRSSKQYGEQAQSLPRRLDRSSRSAAARRLGSEPVSRAGRCGSLPLYSELEFKTLLAKLQPPVDLPLFETETKLEGHLPQLTSPSVDPPEFVRLAAEHPRARRRAIASPLPCSATAIGLSAAERGGLLDAAGLR